MHVEVRSNGAVVQSFVLEVPLESDNSITKCDWQTELNEIILRKQQEIVEADLLLAELPQVSLSNSDLCQDLEQLAIHSILVLVPLVLSRQLLLILVEGFLPMLLLISVDIAFRHLVGIRVGCLVVH